MLQVVNKSNEYCASTSLHILRFLIILTFIAQVGNCNFHVGATTDNRAFQFTNCHCNASFPSPPFLLTDSAVLVAICNCWRPSRDVLSMTSQQLFSTTVCNNIIPRWLLRQHRHPMITSETKRVSLNVSSLLNVIISYCFNMTLMNFLAKVLLHHLMHFYFLFPLYYFLSFFRSVSFRFIPFFRLQLIYSCLLLPFYIAIISMLRLRLVVLLLLLLLLFNSCLV